MATGWAPEGAVQDQIDSTVDSVVQHARSRLPAGESLTHCEECEAPIPEARFCPTGGITVDNAKSYLSLPNVMCVGGSWLTPKAMVDAEDWDGIRELARQAAERFHH